MLSDRDYYRQENPFPRQSYWSRHSAVFHLIIINIAIFLMSGFGDERSAVMNWCALIPGGGYQYQLWRLITYQFLHANFWHIAFNMYSLWLFGSMIEGPLGKRRFLFLYFFSGVLGGVFFLLANWGAGAVCVGASGAIFGVMVAAMAYPHAQFMLLIPPIPIRLWVMVLIYCLIEVFSQLGGNVGNVAHLAHLGGALGGFLFMRRLGVHLYLPDWLKSRPRPSRPSAAPSAPPRPSKPFVYDQTELNRILDKMSRQGYAQLTADEQETLRQASEELKRRRNG